MIHPRAHPSEVFIEGKRLETLSYPAQPGKVTIVMLHEGLGSIAMWKRFPSQLADLTGCGILLYSRYGYGKSDRLQEKRPANYLHHEATVVLPALLKKFELSAPILFGHSDGASISLLYAGSFPGSPRALILEAPHVFVEDVTLAGIERTKAEYETGNLRLRLARYHQHVDEAFWGWCDIWLDPAFRNWNIEGELVDVRCPVLLLQGEDDEYATVAQVNAIKTAIPGTEVAMLAGCRHSPHVEQTDVVLGRVTEFLQTLDNRPEQTHSLLAE